MKIHKHVKTGGVIGLVVGTITLASLLPSAWQDAWRFGNTELRFFPWLLHPENLAGILIALLFSVTLGMFVFWLGGHILRFIKHQWTLASERQTHKRLLKAKQLLDAGIFSAQEYQATIAEIKAPPVQVNLGGGKDV